ncbi:MAG: metallophosphoesterase family protein [Candidatus Bathyarchaeota archaeon]|nr:MAG: metallophosphoesterase family protein [Candidatus Bathyarchaeota archaeon]
MRFAVLADAHIGRSIPLAIAEHRRRAFSRSVTKAVDAIIEAGADYIFLCGDLFERRTLRPHLVQFAHDELYRIARETEERHGKKVTILAIRGNHDGRPQSDTLDYIKHPLADYLHVFEEDTKPYTDKNLTAVGLNYYDRIDAAYERLAKPALKEARGLKVLMVHGFVQGYNQVPPYSRSLTLDQIAEAEPVYVFTGHYHKRCPPRRLPNGGWILTPGSLEMYDFAESGEKGFYIVDDEEAPRFTWVPIESMHVMKQARIETERRRSPRWFGERILEEVELFRSELGRSEKPGYLRVRVRGGLKDGFPGDIDLEPVDRMVREGPLLLWVDIDTLGVGMPILAGVSEREQIDVAEFFAPFGEFAEDIQEMHARVREVLEEQASVQTGLLTPSQRIPLIDEWVRRLEARTFREEEQ